MNTTLSIKEVVQFSKNVKYSHIFKSTKKATFIAPERVGIVAN